MIRGYLGRLLMGGVLAGGVGLPGASAAADPVSDVKLLLHLETQYRPPTSLACSGTPTVQTHGELNTDYYAFVVAANIDTAMGLQGASFGIYYHSEGNTGLSIRSWTSLAGIEQPGANWPDPGTGIKLLFTSCRGTVPDPDDPEGRGLAVLGYFELSATGTDWLGIVPTYSEGYAPMTATPCSGSTREISARAGGYVGFGSAYGGTPCLAPIDVFESGCCLGTGCQWIDPLYCEYLVGTLPPPLTPCSELNCSTPVLPTTWGRIKAIYH